jgi:hypothetical protein
MPVKHFRPDRTIKTYSIKRRWYFTVTQNPMDVPAAYLLSGLKIQHALRHLPNDRKAMQSADNYPSSDYYNTSEVLTSLGIEKSNRPKEK